MIPKDARDYQILFLSLFLFLGVYNRDWTLRPDFMLVVFASCLGTQWGISVIRHGMHDWWTGVRDRFSPLAGVSPTSPLTDPSTPSPLNLRSAVITSLGLCLLLRADHYSTMAIAGCLAISSKFLFQVRGKHFFNPANFGIIAVLLLTHDAWVSPGQWGEEGWYGLLFVGAGGLVLQRVGRWDTTAAFLGSYAVLEAIRNVWLGWTWDVFGHRLMSGSLLLFALFMMTDPRSIPNARASRIIWAVAIAGLTFTLRNYFFLSTAVLWALFALAPLSLLLDYLWSAPQFSWLSGAGITESEADERTSTLQSATLQSTRVYFSNPELSPVYEELP